MIIDVDRQYLEIKELNSLVEVKKPNAYCKISLLNPPDFQINKFLYKQVGKNHRWIDRLAWSDNQWMNYVNSSKVKTYILTEKDELVGYFEQIFYEAEKDSEIAYFGVLEEYIGQRYGGYLLSEAIKMSFENGSKRVWVHTCSLDHKLALQNYKARGMKVFKSENLKIS